MYWVQRVLQVKKPVTMETAQYILNVLDVNEQQLKASVSARTYKVFFHLRKYHVNLSKNWNFKHTV